MSVIAVETVSYDNHVPVPSGKSEIRNAMAVEDTRKLHFGWRPALGVKGSRVYLQTKGRLATLAHAYMMDYNAKLCRK